MIEQATLNKLHALASSLVMVGVSSPLDQWRAISDAAEDLACEFLRLDLPAAQEMAELIGSVADSLADGVIANPGAGVTAIHSLINALQGLETPSGIPETLRKQAHAETLLFFRDIKKEETWVEEESAFAGDEEQREILIAIQQRLEELEAELLNLRPPERDPETVRSVFRQFHTLKGEGAISGLRSLADLCHQVESELEGARHGHLVITQEIVSILHELTALLRTVLNDASNDSFDAQLFQDLIGELHNAVNRASMLDDQQHVSGTKGPDKDTFDDFFDILAHPENPEPSRENEPDEHPKTETDPNEGEDDDLLMVGGFCNLSDAPSTMSETVGHTDGSSSGPLFTPPPEEPPPKDEPENTFMAARRNGGNTVIDSGELTVNGDSPTRSQNDTERRADEPRIRGIMVDVTRLDELLEIVSEVSLLGSYITGNLTGNNEMALHASNLTRACGRLREAASALRLTTIRPLFMAVRRAAADAARASRKMINISMHGLDTQVDRSIVENLSAALVHLVRNAVDHGIEPADQRQRLGKPERGSIHLSAIRTNSDIVIELSDDGKGFDLQSIRDKAIRMGKLSSAAALSDNELADLVFLPGLTTAKTITGLSGRGVGMEIVRSSIDALRGRIEINTSPSAGTTIRMRFPQMVAALDAMLVRVGESILAIPVSQIRECFRPLATDVSTIENRGTIVSIRGVILPVLDLAKEFGIVGDATRPENGVLLVIETGEALTAVLVDETLGSSNVVIRPLDGPLQYSDLVAGAAILPNGRIGLIIETTKLTERVATTASKAFSDAGDRQTANSRQVDTVSIGSNQVGMIDFSIKCLDGRGVERTHVFAINAFKTREFVPVAPLRSVPGAPAGFAGLMLLRDTTIPVLNLGVVLGLLDESQRRDEWEQIVLICEFSGKTVGFLVTAVERVSYISWSDIMPPPDAGGVITGDYVVGTILMSKLIGTLTNKTQRNHHAGQQYSSQQSGTAATSDECASIAFVLDFERIVGTVMRLYGDLGSQLGDMSAAHSTILLVEDSPLIRRQTTKALTAAGITVMEAGDGQEAWDIIMEMRNRAEQDKTSIFSLVDLILTDIEMPRLDGYTLTNNIKQDPILRVLPVLLHSSITNDNMINRAAEVEADGFIQKCHPDQLAQQLRKFL